MLHQKLVRYRLPAALAGLALAACTLAGVIASDLPAREDAATGVREVVQLQLRAFEHDDAKQAFDLADPDVRSKFGDANDFLAMVRAHYPMVHRPSAVEFLPPESDGKLAFQRVRVTDTSGSSWIVTYLLNRQQDRQWRISACLVVPDGQRVTT
jgi:hypothetical protein